MKWKKNEYCLTVFQAEQFSCSLAYVTIRNRARIRIISNIVSFDGGREPMDTMGGNFLSNVVGTELISGGR